MLTLQEMFTRAVVGLRSQGWKRSVRKLTNGGEECCYDNGAGMRCAWGWIDPSLKPGLWGSVSTLRSLGVGLAVELDYDSLRLAEVLQAMHDIPRTPKEMESEFSLFAIRHDLDWPAP